MTICATSVATTTGTGVSGILVSANSRCARRRNAAAATATASSSSVRIVVTRLDIVVLRRHRRIRCHTRRGLRFGLEPFV